MKENVIQIKTFHFALDVINLYKKLIKEKEFVISKQLLRAGTSIGANIEEAVGGYSKKDFLSKITIAYKESRETKYWLKLLYQSDYISNKTFDVMVERIEEILKILGAIQKTSKNNIRNS